MAEIKNCKKKIILTISNFNIAIKKYEVERSYDYSTEPGFNKEHINIASGHKACKVKIFGTLYSTSRPAYALDTALKNGVSSGLAFDNMIFDNMALSSYRIKGSSDDLAVDVELEYVSATSTGGPLNV